MPSDQRDNSDSPHENKVHRPKAFLEVGSQDYKKLNGEHSRQEVGEKSYVALNYYPST